MHDRYGEEPSETSDELWSAERNRLSAIRACVLCDETGVRDGYLCSHKSRRGDVRRAAKAEIDRVLAEKRAATREAQDRLLGRQGASEGRETGGAA